MSECGLISDSIVILIFILCTLTIFSKKYYAYYRIGQLNIFYASTEAGNMIIRYNGTKLWNNLPDE